MPNGRCDAFFIKSVLDIGYMTAAFLAVQTSYFPVFMLSYLFMAATGTRMGALVPPYLEPAGIFGLISFGQIARATSVI